MSRAARVSHLMRARSYAWPTREAKHNYAVIVNGVVAFKMHARNITEVANASRGALNVRVTKCLQ